MGTRKKDAEISTPGRPRNADTERRIVQIALERLAEEGYSRMSLDDIALRAGVSKPTIYRRWKGKADLATAAIRTLQIAEPPVATGSPREDLVGILRNFRRSLLRPNGFALIGTVLAEEAHTPELLRFFRQRIVAPRRRMLRVVLERAAASGQLRRGVDPRTAAALLIGAFYARYLAGPRIPARFPEDVVRLVWDGIARG
ncbi:MAG TPA: TetR/AcrR family transcriptional regulator [Candidatus Acidoferrum sp.]|nr:TetR/AcrR family transcriptional regulator [Candidatus Acidoferrum sp.]